jgi:hypothetical protein
MNIKDFERSINAIYPVLKNTKISLKYQDFTYPFRIEFNEALNKINSLLFEDSGHLHESKILWHSAYRIGHLDAIYRKVWKIRKYILNSQGPKYFCRKIRDKILPPLYRRIEDTKNFTADAYRLPFSIGDARDNFYNEGLKKIEFSATTVTKKVEREFYHLLVDNFPDQILKRMNVDYLEGNLEIYT